MAGAAACARCSVVPRSCRPWRRVGGSRLARRRAGRRNSVVRASDAGAALEEWMSDDGSFETMGVKVFNFGDESGYAGIATRAIKKGDVLVRVPRSKMLTALDARSCPSIGNAAKLLSDERALVLKLLHEKFCFDDEKNKSNSQFVPWLATLPSFAQLEETHPLLWQRERRRAVLKGSPTLQKVENAKANALVDKNAIDEAVERTKISIGNDKNITIEDVLWANAIVASRAFYLEGVDEGGGGGDVDDDSYAEFEIMNTDEGLFDEFDSFDEDALEFSEDDDDVFDPSALNADSSFDDDSYAMNDSVDEPTYSSSTLTLVPWADSLNHSPSASDASRLRWDKSTNSAFLSASENYGTNNQVFDTYGVGMSRQATFLAYGIVALVDQVNHDVDGVMNDESDNSETTKSYVIQDICYVPGSWFWEQAGAMDSETQKNDSSNVLSLLAKEEVVSGASHRASILGVLVAAGVAPETTEIRVTSGRSNDKNGSYNSTKDGTTNNNKSKSLGDGALRWCAAVVATRAEFFAAGWNGPLSDDTPLTYTEANSIIQKLGANPEAQTRAKGTLARLLSKVLSQYPSFAKFPSLASGVGKTPKTVTDDGGTSNGSTGNSQSGKHAVAVSDAAAALVMASEARAMRAALEEIVGWTE